MAVSMSKPYNPSKIPLSLQTKVFLHFNTINETERKKEVAHGDV